MKFQTARLRRLAFLIGAAWAMVLSARAQQGGEPIIFSSPSGGGVSSNLTQLSKPVDVPDTTSFAPSGLGPDLPSGEAPPLAIPPSVSISEGQQLQHLLNPKKDWTLMTPAEIMGVTSPEQILQVPDRDAMGLRKNPGALESFLGRQNGSQSAATNDFSQDDAASDWRFPNNRDFQTDARNPVSDSLDSPPQTLSQLFSSEPFRTDNFGGQNNGGNLWQKFGRSSPMSSSLDSSQPTELDQFKKMLGMDSQASTAPGLFNSDNSSSFSPQPSPDNNFGQPVVNPAGASYAPLTSGIGTPTGLPPLPTATGPSSLQPAITPAWAPQTPPWMSQGPQPFVIPQRKF